MKVNDRGPRKGLLVVNCRGAMAVNMQTCGLSKKCKQLSAKITEILAFFSTDP